MTAPDTTELATPPNMPALYLNGYRRGYAEGFEEGRRHAQVAEPSPARESRIDGGRDRTADVVLAEPMLLHDGQGRPTGYDWGRLGIGDFIVTNGGPAKALAANACARSWASGYGNGWRFSRRKQSGGTFRIIRTK